MKRSAARIGFLPILGGAAVAILVLLLWSGSGEHSARAYPGLTVGIDLNTSTTNDSDGDGDYDGAIVLSKFERCLSISAPGVPFTIEVFVLDVVDLVTFAADLTYDASIVNITGVNTNRFLGAQPGSDVVDASGTHTVGAFDMSQQGDDGSGVLARLTLQGVAEGASPFNLDFRNLSDPPPGQDFGVDLRDGAVPTPNHLGDGPDGDLFFDGPFINEQTTISVGGGGDPDGDGRIAGCDDNCPDDSNPGQEDMDNDGQGDVCDADKDGDGFENVEETGRGSADNNSSRTPEVCNNPASDEDGDGTSNEGYDYLPLPSGNGVPDCTESVDTDGDTTPNTSDTDDDNDGFTDVIENWTGTNSLDRCADTTTPNNEWDDKWAPDADDSRSVNVLDILKFKPAFNSDPGDAAWRKRFDLDKSSSVTILDILKVKPHFGTACVP